MMTSASNVTASNLVRIVYLCVAYDFLSKQQLLQKWLFYKEAICFLWGNTEFLALFK
jgi:hypothetical protein